MPFKQRLSLVSVVFFASCPTIIAAETRPNIVLIMADDMGYECCHVDVASPHAVQQEVARHHATGTGHQLAQQVELLGGEIDLLVFDEAAVA